ncbi:amino acid permease-domain-containing protein [Aspergillus nidulans var. acristatus]
MGVTKDHGDLHRSFTPRQVHVIALGSKVGSGLFIGTGKALANGGPANMILAFFTVCIAIWAHLRTSAEMTIAFPTSGSYIDYADRWVDPALAFGAGLAAMTAVFASEATFFVVLVDYWAEGVIPEAAVLSIFIVICLAVFFLPNTYFAWLQYFGSLVKVFLFVFFVIISLAIIGGAGPTDSVKDGSTWMELPAFKNGFGGFASAALLAIWAVGDQIYIGPMRFPGVFYMVLVTFASVIVPSSENRLLGGSGSAASPFVIAVDNTGINGVPDLVSACMIIGILAIALGGTEVLNWFIAITSASFFINFAIVALTSFRFRAVVKAQKATFFTESYSWQSLFGH